jgi:uncharacterized protein (TIRG00374 family)
MNRLGEAATGTESGRRRGLWWRLALLVALITAAILLFDLRAVGAALISLPPSILVLALVIGLLDRCLMGYKWRQLINAGGEQLRLRDAISAYFQVGFTSRLVPAAAAHDVFRGYLAGRFGISTGLLVGSITLEKLMAMLASVSVAGIALCYLVLVHGLGTGNARSVLLLALGVGVVVTAGALVTVLSRTVHRWAGRLVDQWVPRRFMDLARKASRATLDYRHRGTVLSANFVLAVAEYGLQVAKMLVLALGLGVAIPLLPLTAIIALALYARRIIAYVESWGLAEAGGVATFVLLGIGPELAIALAVANYAITTIVVLPGGYLLYKTGLGRSGAGRGGTRTPPAGHGSISSR